MPVATSLMDWSPVGTALVLVFMAFVAFISKRAVELVLEILLGMVRGRPNYRHISAVGHREIKRLLAEIMLQTRAFRVCVYQFHNGTQFFRANHLWKVSLTHESTHAGVTPTAWKDASDLPIVAVMEFVGPMIDNDAPERGIRMLKAPEHRAAYYDINNMPVCAFQALTNANGVRHAVAVNLVEKSTQASIGVLVAFFDDLAPPCETACTTEMPKCLDKNGGLRVACTRAVDFFLGDMVKAADRIQFYLTTDFEAFRSRPGFWARLFGK